MVEKIETICVALAFMILLGLGCQTRAEEPLHKTIDRLIEVGTSNFRQSAAPLSDDAQFLRRVYLDLTGVTPTAIQARAFLDDTAADKRAKLIDTLLASPAYASHLTNIYSVLLLDRRGPKVRESAEQWNAFLRDAFAADKPWDQIARQILGADGVDPATVGPARFYLDREGEKDRITRDVGRVFLGVDLTCAQCHDHLRVKEWKQETYFGLQAFFVRSSLFEDKTRKTFVYAEEADGEVTFESVFDIRDKKSPGPQTTGPKLFNVVMPAEPKLSKDEAYVVKPAEGVAPVPRFSRRSQLPVVMTSKDNRQFARTAANQLWWIAMGRGIVHPIDQDSSRNPASHPQLLDALTDALIASEYRIKPMLRQMLLSETYQRSSRASQPAAPSQTHNEATFAAAILKPLTPEQLAQAVLQATGELESLAKDPKKLEEFERNFVRYFAGIPGDPQDYDYEATVEQALYLANDNRLNDAFGKRGANLTARLDKMDPAKPDAIAEELFLSVLTRKPTDTEAKMVADHLEGSKEKIRTSLISELVWALVTSAEFRFNH